MAVGKRTVGPARAADASQAAYFRGILADERQQVAGDLLRSRVQLRACVEGDKVVGLRTMARLRSEIRTLEAKQRDLDRLITALDRRFAPPWASEG